MRAARFYSAGDIRVEDVPEPVCGPDQVKIAPAFAGICGTDLHEYLHGPMFTPSKPHTLTGETVPITLGHEFSGVVKELGTGVTGLELGQPVVVRPQIWCGACMACNLGAENACSKKGFIGLSGGGGGLSDAVVVERHAVLPLPANIPLDVAALVEPIACAWRAISVAGIEAGASCLVLGGGPLGSAVIQCLVAKKVGLIVVSEVAQRRQELAKEFGAHHVLDPQSVDVAAEVKKLTQGDGVDVAFDCAGVAASIKAACLAVRVRGTVVNVAVWGKEVPFSPNWLLFKEARLLATFAYTLEDFKAVIDNIAAGALRPQAMITSRIRLEHLVEDGFVPLVKEKDKHVKILIDINS